MQTYSHGNVIDTQQLTSWISNKLPALNDKAYLGQISIQDFVMIAKRDILDYLPPIDNS